MNIKSVLQFFVLSLAIANSIPTFSSFFFELPSLLSFSPVFPTNISFFDHTISSSLENLFLEAWFHICSQKSLCSSSCFIIALYGCMNNTNLYAIPCIHGSWQHQSWIHGNLCHTLHSWIFVMFMHLYTDASIHECVNITIIINAPPEFAHTPCGLRVLLIFYSSTDHKFIFSKSQLKMINFMEFILNKTRTLCHEEHLVFCWFWSNYR